MLFWGMSFVWTTIVFKYYQPITTIFFRLVLSSIILFIGIKIFTKREKIQVGDYKWFLISALLNPFLYFLGESYGLKFSSSTISAVIISTIPVFTPILAYYSLKERLSKLNIVGLTVSFLGIILMLVNKDFSLNTSPLGVLCLFSAVIIAIGYSILLKKLTLKYSAFTIIAVQNLIGAIYFLPLFLIFDFNHFISITPNYELISSLIQLSFFASSLAYVFYTIAIRELGVSKTNILTNFIPIFTAVFSYYVLSEYFNINKILGMVIVITGVFLSQVDKKSQIINFYRFFLRFKNKS